DAPAGAPTAARSDPCPPRPRRPPPRVRTCGVAGTEFCPRYLAGERGALWDAGCGEPVSALGALTPLWGGGPAPPGPPRWGGTRGDRAWMHRGDRDGPAPPRASLPRRRYRVRSDARGRRVGPLVRRRPRRRGAPLPEQRRGHHDLSDVAHRARRVGARGDGGHRRLPLAAG